MPAIPKARHRKILPKLKLILCNFVGVTELGYCPNPNPNPNPNFAMAGGLPCQDGEIR
jgi:hypothetical protein